LINPITKSKYFSITPSLSPTSRYDDLKVGDEIKLFSISTQKTYCNGEVRLFDNETDPKPTDPGMAGGDFSNGFTIGGIQNVYEGNIESNKTGCPSFTQYFIYNDLNSNGIYDDGDKPLPFVNMSIPSLNRILSSDQQGNLQFHGLDGEYDAIIYSSYGQWVKNEHAVKAIISSTTVFDTLGFISASQEELATSNINNSWLRCSSVVKLQISALNTSSTPLVGSVMTLKIDERSKLISSNIPVESADQKTYTWNIPVLHAGYYFKPQLEIEVPQALSNNDSLHFEVTVTNAEKKELSSFRYADVIRCSFDPNDKRSWPNRLGEENLTLSKEKLIYTIRFQNTGNDTAFLVKVFDVLDKNLDPKTLRILDASHEVTPIIQADTAVFVFDKIALPDSTTDYVGSQGFVSFSIKLREGIAENTIIKNTADIVFDKNEAIVTNTTKNTVVNELPCPLDAIWVEDDRLVVNLATDVYQWFECYSNQWVATTNVPYWAPMTSGSYYCMIKGDYCISQTQCKSYVISSIEDEQKFHSTIYPNPTNDYTIIRSNDAVDAVEMYNYDGKLIYAITYLDDQNIRNLDISSFNEGQYVVKVFSKDQLNIHRLVIQNK
jgi:hypothetical protein